MVANAVSYVVAFGLLLAVPAVPRTAHVPVAGSWGVVLRDRPYRVLFLTQLAYSMAMMVLNIAIPVYATTVLGLSGWVVGAVFTLNTVLVGLGQGLVVRAMTGAVRWRVLLLANLVFVVSFVLLLGAGRLSVGLGTAVLLVGSLVYTLGELLGGPVQGALSVEAAPEHLRGRYLALIQLAWSIASTVAPVSFAWLLDRGPSPIWLALVLVSLGGALLAVRLGQVMPHAAERVSRPASTPVGV